MGSIFRQRLGLYVIFMLACTTTITSSAEAGKRFAIIGMGQHISECGPIPASLAAELPRELSGFKVGYAYSSFSVFWLDVWTWGGKTVLCRDDSYFELSEKMLSELKAAGVDTGPPLLYRIPPGGIVVVLFALGAVALEAAKRRMLHTQLPIPAEPWIARADESQPPDSAPRS
jgi:hypothetical protein